MYEEIAKELKPLRIGIQIEIAGLEEEIRSAIAKLGLTDKEVAKRAGMAHGNLRAILGARRDRSPTVPIGTLLRLCDVVGVDPSARILDALNTIEL